MINTRNQYTAGVDEVGRGCIAGDVVAAAVIFPHDANKIKNVKDSKKLSSQQRCMLDSAIKQASLSWSIGISSVAEIDKLNILQASLLAMQRAIENLQMQPDIIKVDGNYVPNVPGVVEAIIKGDETEYVISAASIVAKVYRDQYMCSLDKLYSGYGFKQNKGYPTKLHLAALLEAGITSVHRKSFKPVRKLCLRRI